MKSFPKIQNMTRKKTPTNHRVQDLINNQNSEFTYDLHIINVLGKITDAGWINLKNLTENPDLSNITIHLYLIYPFAMTNPNTSCQ